MMLYAGRAYYRPSLRARGWGKLFDWPRVAKWELSWALFGVTFWIGWDPRD